MKRYSIKKVKFDGIVGTSLGYSQSYGIVNGIDMTDVHTYRFNVRKGEFEFEETETL